MLPSKLKLVYCHSSREIRKHLLCKVEVYYFMVTTILGQTSDVLLLVLPSRKYIQWASQKKGCRGLLNSYVANIRFANRKSLGKAPPLACRAVTMVKFPTKNGDGGLHQRIQILNARVPQNVKRYLIKLPCYI